MATLEGRLFPEEEPIVEPVVRRLPAEWRVQIVRTASPVFDVRVLLPDGTQHRKTFGPNTDGDDIARFLEWVRDNPRPDK